MPIWSIAKGKSINTPLRSVVKNFVLSHKLVALSLAALLLTACQQQPHLMQNSAKPLSFDNMTAYSIAVLPATAKKHSFKSHIALLYANSLNRALIDQYGTQLTLIAPNKLAKTIGHYQPHQQHLSTFISQNRFMPTKQTQQLALIYPHLRYLFVITILQDHIRHDRRINQTRYLQRNGNPIDQKRNWFATYMTIRELTADIQIYDLLKQRIVWSNEASVARTTVKTYHQIINKNATDQQVEQNKHYPKPIETAVIAHDLFTQITEQLPQQE